MMVCDFSECPFELMSFCDDSFSMRCPDCPYVRFVPDAAFDDAEALEYSGCPNFKFGEAALCGFSRIGGYYDPPYVIIDH